jgi:hypothetical protein
VAGGRNAARHATAIVSSMIGAFGLDQRIGPFWWKRGMDLSYKRVISEICQLHWASLTVDDLTDVAWAYYHFSIQFRENLEIAIALYPDD